MSESAIEMLGARVDEAFFWIGIAILAIEFATAAFAGKLRGRTIGEMLVSASTQVPFLAVEVFVLSAGYGAFYVIADARPWSIPDTSWTLALAVLVADFSYYWEHRIAHRVRILWTQHAVHHSSRDMNIVTGVRFGPFEGVWSLCAMLPMMAVGFSPNAVFFGILTVLAYQTWIHTELIGKLGPLELVLNTPSHHRVHHGSQDEYVDRNYGGILIVWDRLFGTLAIEDARPRYGLQRDFDSRNPLRVWFSELPKLWADLGAARSLGEVWSYVFAPPAWRPSSGAAALAGRIPCSSSSSQSPASASTRSR